MIPLMKQVYGANVKSVTTHRKKHFGLNSLTVVSPFPEAVWKGSVSRRATKPCWRTRCWDSLACIRRTARTFMSHVRCLLKGNLWPCLFAPRTKPSAHVGSEYLSFLHIATYNYLPFGFSGPAVWDVKWMTVGSKVGIPRCLSPSSTDSVLFSLSLCPAGMSGCGYLSSTRTFPKVPRWLSQCGTSMGPAEPFLLGEPLSPCLANMGEPRENEFYFSCTWLRLCHFGFTSKMNFRCSWVSRLRNLLPQAVKTTYKLVTADTRTSRITSCFFLQYVPARDAWPESLARCGGGWRGAHHHTGTHQ